MSGASVLTGAGLVAVMTFLIAAFGENPVLESPVPVLPGPRRVRLLAVGDVNLGRQAGQEILRGDTLYPFVFVIDTFRTYDIVFANLECTLSDQDGETQDPENNLIFTGPPEGSFALKQSGVTVVSTANNHALDYGTGAQEETIRSLMAAGIQFAGTATESALLHKPLLFTRNSIRFALFACTDVMNIGNPIWKRYVADADTGRLLPEIRMVRDSVDFVIVSYHGGEEYSSRPTKRTEWFAEQVVHAGADLFLGHHPHVPQGIRTVEGKVIAYSLGNFVFSQPFQEWTQRSFALTATIVKDRDSTHVEGWKCLPVVSGLQPFFTQDPVMSSRILQRIMGLSSIDQKVLFTW